MYYLDTLKKVLSAYDLPGFPILPVPHGNGLINKTWKVTVNGSEYILQRINETVFKEPGNIAYNIHLIAEYVRIKYPGYLFTTPVKTKSGAEMVHSPEGHFRLFPFIKNSHTINVAGRPEQAYEASKQFGMFTKILREFPVNALKTTIPDFHNLTLRFQEFEDACKNGNPARIKEAHDAVQFIRRYDNIVKRFQQVQTDADFKLRVTHHDTKISNVLFDKNGKGLCVADLDTVMPGFFISDVGDMMRTYLSPVSEEEKDLGKIIIRIDFFKAIVEGYLQEMAGDLTGSELNHFVYGGMFMAYMQAVRFLTDYLNNDTYYGADYKNQNYLRALNQLTLLQRLLDKEHILTNIVMKYLHR